MKDKLKDKLMAILGVSSLSVIVISLCYPIAMFIIDKDVMVVPYVASLWVIGWFIKSLIDDMAYNDSLDEDYEDEDDSIDIEV